MKPFRLLLCGMSLAVVSGCTSFEGAPRPVIGPLQNINFAKAYPIDQSLKDFNDYVRASKADEAKRYRNTVMAIYMNAIDAQYGVFRRKLNNQRKGASLGLEMATLGLTGAVPLVATGTKDILGALANGATGTRTAIDKELYFQQTLPALLAAMDADRNDAKANLLNNMKKSADDYPMAVAFADLGAYETAASFERATDKLTAAASADRKKADAKLENAVAGCNTDEDLSGIRQKILAHVYNVHVTTAALAKMAARLDVSKTRDGTALSQEDLQNAISDKLGTSPCEMEALKLIDSDFTNYEKAQGDGQ